MNDDYKSEKQEVWQTMKKKLSLNEYLAKCVLGPMMAKYDNMDSKAKQHRHGGKGDDACCVLL